MRTTVTLDDDVFEAARAQAQASELKLGEVLPQLARRVCELPHKTPLRVGFPPLIRIQPSTEIIPGGRARELLAEDTP